MSDTGARKGADGYDVAVVGAGLAGLCSAALLARAGLNVVVAERNPVAGGYAQTFQRGPYLFDPAIHVTLEAGPGGFTPRLLAHLGVADRVRFVETTHTFRADYPGLTVHAPPGRAAFLAEYQRLFPASADGLARLFETRRDLFTQLSTLPQKLNARDLESAMAAAPLVFRYRMATVADVIDEHIDDPTCAAVLGSLWPYVGSPPSRLSFLLFNQMLETLHKGSHYAAGGFSTLADALVLAIEQNGGRVLLEAPVRRIILDGDRAAGIELVDGRRVAARAVISGADAHHTFRELVGEDRIGPALLRRLRRSVLSPSAFALYGVLRADPAELDLAHENFVFASFDHDRTWADIADGRPGGVWVNVPTVTDPSLAPDGRHLTIVTALTPAVADGGRWKGDVDAYTAALLAAIEPVIPDAAHAIELVDVATPDTFADFSGNTGGAIYGWENSPAQTASKRLPHRTPIDRLYLAGHWTEEGSSSFRVLTSGHAAATMVAVDLDHREPIPAIGGPSALDDA